MTNVQILDVLASMYQCIAYNTVALAAIGRRNEQAAMTSVEKSQALVEEILQKLKEMHAKLSGEPWV
jgi:hypothetical protein